MKNIKDTVMSQYANSPVICSLIFGLNECLDTEAGIVDFYKMAMNVHSAQGFGLDIWGRIVGVGRVIEAPQGGIENFGFKTNDDDESFYPFNSRPFFAAGQRFTNYELQDDDFRLLILIKAASNIVYATAPNINKFLRLIFPSRRIYYLITDHMMARYFLEFMPNAFERHIIYKLQLLPRPCGVMVEYQELPPTDFFGFYGTGFQPFNNGVFAR
ncbi:hypothetical protein AAEX37_01944 [Oligella sp. MSHR50489EDL]|uniref:DUF2612 domain-containing protein n=1 Tax=Oligella sp. MSHR50489EDL TaxID=3139409 RepID=UPI003D813148